MKIECSTEKLRDAVNKADKIIAKNSTLESLKTIFFIASNKTLKIRSTNLSLGLEIEIPANIEKEGEFSLLGEIVNNTLNNINDEKMVNLELKNDNLQLKNKKNSIILKSVPSEDFPNLPDVDGQSFEISVEKFLDGIKSVYYSSSITDIKPEISSVYIYSEENEIYFVSTDSFRLAEKKIKNKNKIDIDGLIIPYKNIVEILKLLAGLTGDMKVVYNKNQISFILPGFYLTSRLIDGVFPDYRQIIPKENKTKVIILKNDLLNALKLSNIFSDKFNQIKIAVRPSKKSLMIYAINQDVGENETVLDASLQGDDIEMNFNYKYILDCFQSIQDDSVVLEFNEINRPILVKGNSDKSFLYLIMPMNR